MVFVLASGVAVAIGVTDPEDGRRLIDEFHETADAGQTYFRIPGYLMVVVAAVQAVHWEGPGA